MSFGTLIHCLDGQVQIPATLFLRDRWRVDYIDVITEAGAAGLLAAEPDGETAQSVYRRVQLSLDAHGSRALAIGAHADCAGNPVPDEEQQQQVRRFPGVDVSGLWVDAYRAVTVVGPGRPGAR